MSSMILSGDTSGAITVTVPAVAGTNTLTLPALTGTVLTTASTFGGTGPSFSAYQSTGGGATSGVWTKIAFQTKEWDTANAFDNSTNYIFQPTVAGYYVVNGSVTASTVLTTIAFSLYKNGSEIKRLFNNAGGGTTSSAIGSCQVYLNGSTDYIALYVNWANTQNTFASQTGTYFQASLVRTA